MNTQKHRLILLVGPTAVGKTELAIQLAEKLNGEIVSADSRLFYRGMDIGTAKPTREEQVRVPHHLIDVVSPHLNFTAADWAREAIEKVEAIEARGRIPVLVGGTGFYLRALRQPFFPSPPTDEVLRQRVTKIHQQRGPKHLHQILQRLDPNEAQELHERDWPRVQRAIEFYMQTGEQISRQKPLRPEPTDLAQRIDVFALNPPRKELYAQINVRTEEHFARGLVEEVRELLDRGVPSNSNALGAHGYRRVVEYLKGERTRESAVEQTKLDVRHYAKRQLTWFRREPGVVWIDRFGVDPEAIKELLGYLNLAATFV